MFKADIDITQEFKSKNYAKIIDYVDQIQQRLIKLWQTEDNNSVEHMILMSRNILNFWVDSIHKNRLYTALIRRGALIGSLETIEKLLYEENMDLWLQKKLPEYISSIKYLSDIIQLLDIKGVMTHGEIMNTLQINDIHTLTETMKKIEDLQLINVSSSGNNNLYSLTDIGIRYARIQRD